MNEETATRLYIAGIKEELDHMKTVVKEMEDNPDSPLKEAAYSYYAQLMAEDKRLWKLQNDQAIEHMRELW